MRRGTWLMAATALASLLLAAAVALGAEKKTDQADIRAERFTYHWDSNLWEFTGNCRVEIKGADQATMTAPKMTGKFTEKGTQVSEITAAGPARFDVTTQKTPDGVQRRIVAGCAGEAVYSGATRIVTLTGGAEAEMTVVPADPDAAPTKFSAERLVINLQTLTVEGENVHIEAEIPAEPEQ